MMKLKLGDIEMDSESGISFGESAGPTIAVQENAAQEIATQEQAQPAQPAEQLAGSKPESDDVSLMERLPDWSRKTYLLVALVAAASAIGLGAVAAGLAEAYPAMRIVPLIPVPGLLLAAGISAWRAARPRADSPSMDPLARRRSDTLAGHLSGRRAPASVEELMDELGWREEAVVRGLSAGVDRSLIEEDLDLDTGHWTYAATPASSEDRPARRAMPVEERARYLTSDDE
ncbi:MAG: hypothetical protein ACLFVJ_22030 [Persicimonas sp.]